MSVIVAQLTDTHIREPGRLAYGRLDTAPYLAAAVQSILSLPQRPDLVLMSGDLTDFGRAEEYSHLADLIAPLPMPVYLMAGNHDDRDQMRRSFPSHRYMGSAGFLQYSVVQGDLRILALDSVQPRASAGRLCSQRLDWLQAQLEFDTSTPTLVALHHPPFKTLIGHMDEIGLLEGAQELQSLLDQYPNARRVISGHLHRSIFSGFGKSLASTAPSPAHQVCLDLRPDALSRWSLEPPGYHLHVLTDDGHLLTHSVAIGQFEGPFPFHENGALID